MASNTKLSWRFLHGDNTSTTRVNAGEISYLTGTAEDITEDNFLALASIVELEYPVRTDGATSTNHETILYELKEEGGEAPGSIVYRISFILDGEDLDNIIEFDEGIQINQFRQSIRQRTPAISTSTVLYIGIEKIEKTTVRVGSFRRRSRRNRLLQNFIIGFKVKQPVSDTDTLSISPGTGADSATAEGAGSVVTTSLESNLDSDADVAAAQNSLLDSAIASGIAPDSSGIVAGVDLSNVSSIVSGPTILKDSDGNRLVPRVEGINVDSAEIKNLQADSATIQKITIDSAAVTNLVSDNANIEKLSGSSIKFDSATLDKLNLSKNSSIELGDKNESDGLGNISDFTSIKPDAIHSPLVDAKNLEADSANIVRELKVGRFSIDAGNTDETTVLLDDNYGGLFYSKNSIRHASLKFNEDDDKWHFHPKIRVSDLDSSGIVDNTQPGNTVTNSIEQLGSGKHGQFLSFNGILNQYEWDYIVKTGKIISTNVELARELAKVPSKNSDTTAQNNTKDLIHSTWDNISHGISASSVGILSSTLYPFKDSNLGFVFYDTTSHMVKTLTSGHETNSMSGLISDASYEEYETTVVFTGDSSGKSMGFIIGYVGEGEEGVIDNVLERQSTLTLFRTPNPTGFDGSDTPMDHNTNVYTSYALVLNAFQEDQHILDFDGTFEIGGTTHSTWDAAGSTAIKIKKDREYLRITLSNFGSSIPNNSMQFEFDLINNFEGRAKKFAGRVQYGYATNGVKGGKFEAEFKDGGLDGIKDENSIIDIKNENVYVFIDSSATSNYNLPVGYHLLESDFNGNKIDFFREQFSLGRIFHNPTSVPPKTWYKDPYTTFEIATIFNEIGDDKEPKLGGDLSLNGFGIFNPSGHIVIDPAPVNDSAGLVIIKGNLQVDGTQTTINSTILDIDDKNITVAKGASNAAAADGGGITIDGAGATILYKADSDAFAFNKAFASPLAGGTNLISGYNTNQLSEGTNLYFTTARARSSISVSDAGGDGSLAYNSTSGVITYTGPSASETRAHFSAANAGTATYTQLSYSAGVYTLTVDPLDASEIPNLDASKITSGIFDSARIPIMTYSEVSGTPTSITDLGISDGTSGQILKTDGSGAFTFIDPPVSGVTSVATGTGLSGGPITSTGTISLANTSVTAATYGSSSNIPVIVIDAQGRITSASNQAVNIPAGTTINTNANNRVITGSGTANTLNGEANMTFDGSTLAVTGAITATGNVTAAFSSDLRLKENLEKIDNALEKVDNLNGYTFNWNEKTDLGSTPRNKREAGVIAQEVEKVMPEVVVDRVDGYKAVYYEKLVPILIESIKELKARVEELEGKK